MTQSAASNRSLLRLRLHLTGVVQGVGFRPWVYREATALDLVGSVHNDAAGLSIEVEGPAENCERFVDLLNERPPPLARFKLENQDEIPVEQEALFIITSSDGSRGPEGVAMTSDLAPCRDCVQEMMTPGERRYRYPFTHCTQCGPRFSIIDDLPYDRERTALASFTLCPACRAEYRDPLDRRFHAQALGCAECGPRIQVGSLWAEDALIFTETVLREGGIAAVKGVGGFHLLCDARNEGAVARLRARKRRPYKPLAVLCRDFAQAESLAHFSAIERELLCSAVAPIVLVTPNQAGGLAENIAPGMNTLGIMLPSTPLHHLLVQDLGFPLIATSGNRSGEPLCVNLKEAEIALNDIADVILDHNRPIRRAVDDSIFRVMGETSVCLRNGRGTAPLSLEDESLDGFALAVGGRQKNALAVQRGSEVILGPYIGQLDQARTYRRFEQAVYELTRLTGVPINEVVCDLHPDDEATQFALQHFPEAISVQHHHAHVVSCMLEHQLNGEVLGVSWDGTGQGNDGTVWGGEFLRATRGDFERVGHLRTFSLPGGEAAVREPVRAALGVLCEAGLPVEALGIDDARLPVLQHMLERSIHSPRTTSAGRLFDAVAALLGVCLTATYEGEAAMRLEALVEPHDDLLTLAEDPLDWSVPLAEMLESGASLAWKATAFHNTMAEMILRTAERAALSKVVLTGGCFQNAYLTEQTAKRLEAADFRVYINQRVPPNDGGLAVGQLGITAARRKKALCV